MRLLLFIIVLTVLLSIVSAAKKTPTPRPKAKASLSKKPKDPSRGLVLPIPPASIGPPPSFKTASGQPVVVKELAVGSGVYWATDATAYQTMFMVSDVGVILVDCPGLWIVDAIKSVTTLPVTHYIYSHTHKDHNACGNVFPNAIYIAQDASTRHLQTVQDPARPVPSISFTDRYMITQGRTKNQTVMLESSGPLYSPNHLDGNIFIYSPNSNTLMFVDVVFPGWVPFLNFGVAKDYQTYYTVHAKILSFNFTNFIGGHVTKLGNRQDVIDSANYFDSVVRIVQDVAKVGRETGRFGKTLLSGLAFAPNNAWFGILAAYTEETVLCSNRITEMWKGKLAGVDVYGPSHCESLSEYLRIN